jgi:NAD(P)H-hydrate epimerase
MKTVARGMVAKLYPKRKGWCHKGDFGKVLIIGGSKKYSGSPALAALSAYRAGADLVTVIAPERAADIISSFSPDIIAYPLEGDHLNIKHLKTLLDLAKKTDSVVIGGGLCREKETMKTVVSFLKRNHIPSVIDADAIHAISHEGHVVRQGSIITPHSKEFRELTNEEPEPNPENRARLVKYFASKLSSTILLKGHLDFISDGREVYVNKSGDPMMTKGGTGDTLAGICGALLARRAGSLAAACAGAYINGCAGSLAAKEYGEGMLATDLIEMIPKAIK